MEDVVAETTVKFKKAYPNLTVRTTVPDEIVLVPMDATLIEQVLFNLMENSARHGETATEVRVTVENLPGLVSVSVADNGCGISPERLPTLFSGSYGQMWKSAPDARRNMGIGLSVCWSIVQAHGGRLSAGNLPEGGACFTFTLPLEGESSHEDPG